MADTLIEWADKTWNPITGCTPISAGCANCYAKRMAYRLRGRYGYPKNEPFRPGTWHPEKLYDPINWKKPARIFPVSMGDLFHPEVESKHIFKVFEVMRRARWHQFFVLTKRPEGVPAIAYYWSSHIWAGITVENQRAYNVRIGLLMKITAEHYWLSVEPLLGPMGLDLKKCPVDWLVIGPETGPGRRPCNPDWIRSLIDQADAAGVPVFVKAFPFGNRISKEPAEWPAWARRREAT